MKLDLLNVAALLLALLAAMLGADLVAPRERGTVDAPTQPLHSSLTRGGTARFDEYVRERAPERTADGSLVLRDARGVAVPLRRYRRIASGTLIADRVLADLCEPERVVAYTRYASRTPSAHRYTGKPAIGARDDVEQVLALRPDLLVASDLVDPGYLERLREHGVQVFQLGPMEGLSTLLPSILSLGHLIGAPERARVYGDQLRARLARVAADTAGRERPRALYLSIYGDKLFAAGARTSYHDVITFAGLQDAAGLAGLHGWPELSAEQVLALDPGLLITRRGMTGPLCRHPGLDLVGPCHGAGRVVELDGALLDDPGPTMLEASEALHDAYWTH